MPYLFTVEARYDSGKYLLFNPSDLMSNFSYLDGKVIVGKVISTYRDGKLIKINKGFKSKLVRSGNYYVSEILEPNPLKTAGLPLPSQILVIVYKYEEEIEVELETKKVEFPIAEGILLKGSVSYGFEDESKRILKEEELGILLEGTIFHSNLQKLESGVKETLTSFEQGNFAHTKTSCRKILEEIKQTVSEWKAVDESDSLSEKFKGVVNSLYSFASIGGPHEGVVTREETELILKNTMSLLLYVNSLLKNERVRKYVRPSR